MEEKIKALGGSALDRASAGGVLATEMTLQAAAITKTFAAKLAAREIDKQMAEEETAKKARQEKKKEERRQKGGPKLTAGQEQRLKRAKVISAPTPPSYTHTHCVADTLFWLTVGHAD